jgi:hypothetical protein
MAYPEAILAPSVEGTGGSVVERKQVVPKDPRAKDRREPRKSRGGWLRRVLTRKNR